jgi:hypothetical protein
VVLEAASLVRLQLLRGPLIQWIVTVKVVFGVEKRATRTRVVMRGTGKRIMHTGGRRSAPLPATPERAYFLHHTQADGEYCYPHNANHDVSHQRGKECLVETSEGDHDTSDGSPQQKQKSGRSIRSHICSHRWSWKRQWSKAIEAETLLRVLAFEFTFKIVHSKLLYATRGNQLAGPGKTIEQPGNEGEALWVKVQREDQEKRAQKQDDKQAGSASISEAPALARAISGSIGTIIRRHGENSFRVAVGKQTNANVHLLLRGDLEAFQGMR